MRSINTDKIADQIEQLETAASVGRGLADAAAGRTRPARKAIRALADELGLKLGKRSK
jgi:predicted transcriptional regulator